MKLLNKDALNVISGAGKWSSENSDWGSLPYSPIDSGPATGSQLDYGLMAILMGNAAFFGCLSGARTGGVYGCVVNGTYASVGTMYAMIFTDSYKMWNSK